MDQIKGETLTPTLTPSRTYGTKLCACNCGERISMNKEFKYGHPLQKENPLLPIDYKAVMGISVPPQPSNESLATTIVAADQNVVAMTSKVAKCSKCGKRRKIVTLDGLCKECSTMV